MKYHSSSEADRLFSRLNDADPRSAIDELSFLFEERERGFPQTIFEYDTDHNHAWYLLGLSYEELNEKEKAADCFVTAIAIWPKDADSYVALSNVSPYPDTILALLENGIAETKDDRIRFNIANIYLDIDQPQKALIHLEKICPTSELFEESRVSHRKATQRSNEIGS